MILYRTNGDKQDVRCMAFLLDTECKAKIQIESEESLVTGD